MASEEQNELHKDLNDEPDDQDGMRLKPIMMDSTEKTIIPARKNKS